MKPTSSQPVRAAIYLRISLDREMDGLAIDRQREDCEKLAQFRGWEIVETYVDQSISASDKTKKRPAYLRIELRPGTWTRLMVAVMRLAGGPDLGILPGSGP